MLHPRNPPNREIQISQYLVVHIHFAISVEFVPSILSCVDLVDFGSVAFSVETVMLSMFTMDESEYLLILNAGENDLVLNVR